MYEPGTVLTLREPQSTDDAPYPYDRVVVVGQSPVQHATASNTAWAGPDATGWIIRPLDEHAATIDKPYGELEQMYEVESYPLDPITQQPITPESTPRGPSPLQFLRRSEEGGERPARRAPLPSTQKDGRSPVQMLREDEAKTKKASK